MKKKDGQSCNGFSFTHNVRETNVTNFPWILRNCNVLFPNSAIVLYLNSSKALQNDELFQSDHLGEEETIHTLKRKTSDSREAILVQSNKGWFALTKGTNHQKISIKSGLPSVLK